MYLVHACAPDDPDAIRLLDRLSAALAAITGDSGRSSFDPQDVAVDKSLFVVATNNERVPLGCGAYRPLAPGKAELKRMYASPGTRGLGAVILEFLERRAMADGYKELWLETRQVNIRAISFYERHGYRRIPNFGKYVDRPEAVCFGKNPLAEYSDAFS